MRRASTLLIALAMLMLSAAPGLANNTWAGYHWADDPGDPHDGDITLTLVNDLTLYQNLYTNDVVPDWNGAPGPLILNSNNFGPRPDACDNVATDAVGVEIQDEIHVCDLAYGQNGWLGLARIWVASDGHIDAGVALMNDSYFQEPDSVYNNPVAWRHVLCQEIGHTFGLSHQGSPKKASCMNSRWGLTNPDFWSPNAHDFATLSEIYGSAGGDDGGGGSSKPCNPNRPNCPSGANVHFAPRPGGGWIVTFIVPLRGLR